MKKLLSTLFLSIFLSVSLLGFEIGAFGGNITKPSHLTYGISAGTGLFVPMLKVEFEYFRIHNTELPELPNAMTLGIKFRPKLGNISPYGVVGIGSEFETFGFDLDEKFTFIGGGIHLYLNGMVSFRADIRFLNYSGFNRTRFTGGVFLHI